MHQYGKGAHEELEVTKLLRLTLMFSSPRIQSCHLGGVKERYRFLYHEWNNKAAVLSDMAVRAVCERSKN